MVVSWLLKKKEISANLLTAGYKTQPAAIHDHPFAWL